MRRTTSSRFELECLGVAKIEFSLFFFAQKDLVLLVSDGVGAADCGLGRFRPLGAKLARARRIKENITTKICTQEETIL